MYGTFPKEEKKYIMGKASIENWRNGDQAVDSTGWGCSCGQAKVCLTRDCLDSGYTLPLFRLV